MAIDLGGVKFSIKVGTGRSAGNTRKVADELERLVAVTAKLRKEQGRSAAAHGKYDGSTRKVDQSSRRAVVSTIKWADAVNVLAGAFASLQISKLVDASVKLAGRADVMGTVLLNVGKTANYSAGELSLYESRASAH
jgi:hypothetical protein